jgi:hypothetical protein
METTEAPVAYDSGERQYMKTMFIKFISILLILNISSNLCCGSYTWTAFYALLTTITAKIEPAEISPNFRSACQKGFIFE